MKNYTISLIVVLLITLAISVSAAQTFIPKGTVIPVTLDTPLSSATSNVGDTFFAYHEGINGAGFPEYSNFEGKVESVTKATGSNAGQIGVSFISVHLPNGKSLPINGMLTSLDQKSVKNDPATGRLVGTVQGRKTAGKFIAVGAGAGLLIGQLIGKKPLIGTILGAAAGYIYGNKQAKLAVGKDVSVAEGTPFGVLLSQDVTIPDYSSGTVDTSSNAGNGWQVTFKTLQPKMSGNDLMVPLRSVMESIDIPFKYDTATKALTMSRTNPTQVFYTVVGSRLVYIDGIPTKFDTASKFINGSVYVPASYIELLTQRTAYWNQKSGVLRIE